MQRTISTNCGNLECITTMSFDGSSVGRLEGSSNAPGGLIVKKLSSGKGTTKGSSGGSLLGLQKLAEEKRKEREFEEGKVTKKQKSDTWEDDDDRSNSASTAKHRHYRSKMVETPSHPGGVSDAYREKKKQRDERDREQRRGGVYADTKQRKYKDAREDKREKDWEKRDRRPDEGSRRDRSSRGKGDSTRSTQGRYDWEETPSSRRSRQEREYTPNRSSKGWCGFNGRHGLLADSYTY